LSFYELFCVFELFLALLYHFGLVCRFLCLLLILRLFLVLDDLLRCSWLFGSSSCASGVLDLNFKLCVFVANGFIKGEIEKPSD
jgi:hypothetical protein